MVLDIIMDTECFHLDGQLLETFPLVSADDIHGQDLLDPSPVQQEGEGGPATLASDDLGWDTCREEFASTSDVEAVAVDSRQAASFPD